jgi:antirestriction protein ArdC
MSKKLTKTDERYQSIVNQFIETIENNPDLSWQKTWNLSSKIPKNLTTDKHYRGFNVLALMLQNYQDSRWMTFNQVKEQGGAIKRGEQATPIFFNKPVEYEEENDEGELETKKYWLLKSYLVFNVEQTTLEVEPEQELLPSTTQEIDEFFETLGVEIRYGDPAYHPVEDYITMPSIQDFNGNEDERNSVLCHETIHWTSAKHRLNRIESTKFGSHEYSQEELVAEMGAVFLAKELGIENIDTNKSAAYLKSWLGNLKEEPKLLFQVSNQASKATQYLIEEYQNNLEQAYELTESQSVPFALTENHIQIKNKIETMTEIGAVLDFNQEKEKTQNQTKKPTITPPF